MLSMLQKFMIIKVYKNLLILKILQFNNFLKNNYKLNFYFYKIFKFKFKFQILIKMATNKEY